MQCTAMTTALVCYTQPGADPADPVTRTTLVAHYEYGQDAAGATILVATRYTDPDGTPVDTSTGTVVAGACQLSAPDVEWELLCDFVAGDPAAAPPTNDVTTQFFRRSVTVFDANNDVESVTVADFELDKVTAYVVEGEVVACNQECEPATALGVLTTWG